MIICKLTYLYIFLSTVDTLEKQFMNWKKEFNHEFSAYETQINKMFQDAKSKADIVAKKHSKYNSSKSKTAIMTVNLYTQESTVPNINIYRKVNFQLRTDPDANNVWTRYAALLTRSMNILCQVQGTCERTVYRGGSGCDEIKSKTQTYVTLRGFTSTTTDPKLAISFGNCKLFFKMTQARGLLVDLFSSFGGEKEVLLLSNSSFNITKRLDDKNAIKNVMMMLHITKIPETYFEMVHVKEKTAFVIGSATVVFTSIQMQILGFVIVVLVAVY